MSIEPGIAFDASSLARLPERLAQAVAHSNLLPVAGRVRRVVGPVLHVTARDIRLGELCRLRNPYESHELLAEVVGFHEGAAILTPIGPLEGISTRTEVIPTGQALGIGLSPALRGRVLDALGQPLDIEQKGPLPPAAQASLRANPPSPLARNMIERALPLGIRAIDGLLTCGEGQRIGLFGGPGCGKSTLLASMVSGAEADIIVVGLIGERGREVREFIERELDEQARARSVIIVATSDRPAMERVKAAAVATRVAEYFRDEGQRVLLLMDSVTRYARALREVGLAAGEPPTRRGFPPSVFAELPRLLERSGQGENGSITAIYTVLVEGEDDSDPIAEEVQSILDGHIKLSSQLAASGHYPAVDVLHSISRTMGAVVDDSHAHSAQHFRRLLARYREVELLVQVGEYQHGGDHVADQAVDSIGAMEAFLRQGRGEFSNFATTVQALNALVAR